MQNTPTFDFTIAARLGIASQFEISNRWLERLNPSFHPSTTEKVLTLFRRNLQFFIEAASFSPHRETLEKKRIEIIPFAQVVYVLLTTYFSEERRTEHKNLHAFLKVYLQFMGPKLAPSTLIQDLKEALQHSHFRSFWIEHEALFFKEFGARFGEAQPVKDLDELLLYLFTEMNISTRTGQKFLKSRITATDISLYRAFLANLLAYNRRNWGDPNSLLWGIWISKRKDHKELRRQCAFLFIFLLLGQSEVPLCSATRRINLHLRIILERMVQEELLFCITGCLEWKGLNKGKLLDSLMDIAASSSEVRTAVSILATAIDWGYCLNPERRLRIEALVKNNVTRYELKNIFYLLKTHSHKTDEALSVESCDGQKETPPLKFDESLETVKTLAESESLDLTELQKTPPRLPSPDMEGIWSFPASNVSESSSS